MNHTTIKDNHATPAAESDDDLKATHQCVDAEHVQNMSRDGYCASCGYSILRDTPSEGQIRDAIAAMNITVTAAEHSPLPLCPIHQQIEDKGSLEVQIGGNNCIACSLHERVGLLEILAQFAVPHGSKDSLFVLSELVNEREELIAALRELLDCETNLAGCSGVKLLDAVDTARAVLKRVERKQ